MRVSLDLSLYPLAYLLTYMSDLHLLFCARYSHLWPWLGPPLVALRYVITSGFRNDVMFARNGQD